MKNKILIAEISGKRPGDKFNRPTEKFKFDFDKVIISNNSEGYETTWPIVNVPKEYEEWYKEHCKMSDLAYYAPMNRSYAIKYAREKGYDYLVQLDDNIVTFNIKYLTKLDDGTPVEYSTLAKTPNKENLPSDMFRYMASILDNTNAGMVGMSPDSASVPKDDWIRERYVYSAFMLNLKVIPSYFQGDFEDDIEYRLKLRQIKVPCVSIAPFHYSKTAQGDGKNEDSTGNRAAYIKAGLKRGEHMSKLYGDMYEHGYSDRGSGLKRNKKVKFRHKVKSFKLGVRVSHYDRLKQGMLDIFEKYATVKPDKMEISKEVPKQRWRFVLKADGYYENLFTICSLAQELNFKISRKSYSIENENSLFEASTDFNNVNVDLIIEGLQQVSETFDEV